MKRLLLVAVCTCMGFVIRAQQGSAYRHMFRFNYDNDFINVTGNGSDNAYTFGTRLDYFYSKHHASAFFLDRWLPKAGANAADAFGWSLVQVAFTPDDIKSINPPVNDYPYAGGLFAIHSLYSYNPLARFGIQTELSAGIMGPASYASQTQEWFHRWIKYQLPDGWNRQMPTDLLLNLNITAEKLLWQPVNWIEVHGGAAVKLGTMENAANIYSLIRIGKMVPYYNGFFPQYGSPRENKPSRFQVYAVAKPGLYYTAYNAFVEGGVFTGRPEYYKQSHDGEQPYTTNHAIQPVVDAGIQFVSGKIGLSVTQKFMPALLEGFGTHAVGNITLSVSW